MREPFTEHEARQYSPLALAFLGDSVYEIMVRDAMLRMGNRPVRELHRLKIQIVCASFQAQALEQLTGQLTAEEAAVCKRGQNAGSTPPKNADPADYRKATGLEALFGYLYLTGSQERLEQLFSQIWEQCQTILHQQKE